MSCPDFEYSLSFSSLGVNRMALKPQTRKCYRFAMLSTGLEKMVSVAMVSTGLND
jgi:hypothetical protein